MVDREALLALAAKCEAATGPDRRSDAAIAAIVRPKLFDREDAAHYAKRPAVNRADLNFFENAGVPRYTASLDAAMGLVPEGHHWQVGIGIETEFGKRDKSYAWCDEGDVGELCIAATPALALTAACLKALASQDLSL